jgi:hypothetical protein
MVVAIGPWDRRQHVRLDGLVIRSGENWHYGEYSDAPFDASGLQISGTADVVGCTFFDNRRGYALSTSDGSHLRAIGCRFVGNRNNQSLLNGTGTVHVGWYFGTGSALFANCEFSGNYALDGGGLGVQCATRVVNCSFYGNHADFDGGAIYAAPWSCPSLVVENSILWQNESDQDPVVSVDRSRTSLRIDACLFLGGSASSDGTGNIEGPPFFADPRGPDGSRARSTTTSRCSAARRRSTRA